MIKKFEYICKECTKIGTDVYCVKEWWDCYKQILIKRYKQKELINIDKTPIDLKVIQFSNRFNRFWKIDKESYINALNDERIKELLINNNLLCELGHPSQKQNYHDIHLENACAKIISINDDSITVVPLDNEKGKIFLEEYNKNPKNIYASVRAWSYRHKIEKIVTFDIISTKKWSE